MEPTIDEVPACQEAERRDSLQSTYLAVTDALEARNVEFLIGGGHAFNAHTGMPSIERFRHFRAGRRL